MGLESLRVHTTLHILSVFVLVIEDPCFYFGSMHRVCRASSHIESQLSEGEVDIISHPETRSYLQCTTVCNEKIIFFQWSLTGIVSCT